MKKEIPEVSIDQDKKKNIQPEKSNFYLNCKIKECF